MRAFSFFGAAALLSLGAGQGHAAASGCVGASYSDADEVAAGFEGDDDVWGIEGAAAFEASPGVGVQVGATVADFQDTSFSVDAHLNLRDSRRLIGGFLGAGEVANNTFWAI